MNADSQTSGGLSKDTTNWAMLCHLSALVGLLGNGVGFVLGPLIVWLLKRQEHPFIDEQGKEAVNFQITMFIAFAVSIVLAFLLIGIPLLLILGILEIVFPILAAVRASSGEHYRYPFAIRFIK